MRRLFEASLVRRVMLSLLGAFVLVWVVLLAFEYWQDSDYAVLDRKLAAITRGLVADLGDIADPAEARGTVAGLERTLNRSYRDDAVPATMVVQLQDAAGHRVYASSPWAGAIAAAHPGASRLERPGARALRLFRVDGARWSVSVAQTEVPRAWVLRMLAFELTMYMAIALPCVLLPMWLAVSQGLRPLRRLSQAIAARDPEDLGATGLVARHRELRPLVGAIDELLSRLRAKVNRENAFIHDAAHELRTPMAVISAQAHGLAQAADAQARREAEARLDGSLARAARLVDQLLALARLDDSHQPRRDMVDVSALVQQELAQLAPRAIAAGLELDLDAPETLAFPVEAVALRSIVRNLAVNAILYVPHGGRVRVSLEAGEAGDIGHGGLRLAVADDGPGIAPAERALVFERFMRGAGHDVAGSGLGLAIVRQAARRMGGEVALHDGLDGRGCRFEVRLPPPGARLR